MFDSNAPEAHGIDGKGPGTTDTERQAGQLLTTMTVERTGGDLP